MATIFKSCDVDHAAFGTLNIYWALRKHRRRKFQLILGSVILIICLVNSPATWLMLILQ